MKSASANATAFAELILHLSTGDRTQKELLDHTGISDSTLRKWLGVLQRRNLIYICEYRRTARIGRQQKVYAWNTDFKHTDVARPKDSYAVCSKRYRENKLRNPLTQVARGVNENVEA